MELAKHAANLIFPILTGIHRNVLFSLKCDDIDFQARENSGLIFVNPQTGKKFDNCKKAWSSLLKAAEIKFFRWHDMRHPYVKATTKIFFTVNEKGRFPVLIAIMSTSFFFTYIR